jgi:hypothetical protein
VEAPRGPVVFEDYRANGLPHFTGALCYSLALPGDLPAGACRLQIDGRPCMDAMRLRVDGGEWQVSLWEPRRWIRSRGTGIMTTVFAVIAICLTASALWSVISLFV